MESIEFALFLQTHRFDFRTKMDLYVIHSTNVHKHGLNHINLSPLTYDYGMQSIKEFQCEISISNKQTTTANIIDQNM